MKKGYHLSSCSTCHRIIKELNDPSIVLQDIKSEAISEQQMEEMYQYTSSYEALFSKRAMKYKSMGLKDKNLQEEDYKRFILEEYTFLKRPVFIIHDKIFVGNSKKVIASIKESLANE